MTNSGVIWEFPDRRHHPDLKFTLRQVRCLGCCSMGPVAQIDEEIHGNLSQRKSGQLIKIYNKR